MFFRSQSSSNAEARLTSTSSAPAPLPDLAPITIDLVVAVPTKLTSPIGLGPFLVSVGPNTQPPTTQTLVSHSLADGTQMTTFTSLSPKALSVITFSPDGRYLYTGSMSNQIHKYDAKTLAPVGPGITDLPDCVVEIKPSPGLLSTKLFALCRDGTVAVLDTTGNGHLTFKVKKGKLHQNGTEGGAISCIGTKVVTMAKAPPKKQALKMWDEAMHEISKIRTPHDNTVNGILFHPSDDDIFYTYSQDCSIKTWSFSKRISTHTISNAHDGNILSLSLSASGSRLLSTSSDRVMSVWDSASNQRISSLPFEEELSRAEFCGSSARNIAVLYKQGLVRVFKCGDEELSPEHAERFRRMSQHPELTRKEMQRHSSSVGGGMPEEGAADGPLRGRGAEGDIIDDERDSNMDGERVGTSTAASSAAAPSFSLQGGAGGGDGQTAAKPLVSMPRGSFSPMQLPGHPPSHLPPGAFNPMANPLAPLAVNPLQAQLTLMQIQLDDARAKVAKMGAIVARGNDVAAELESAREQLREKDRLLQERDSNLLILQQSVSSASLETAKVSQDLHTRWSEHLSYVQAAYEGEKEKLQTETTQLKRETTRLRAHSELLSTVAKKEYDQKKHVAVEYDKLKEYTQAEVEDLHGRVNSLTYALEVESKALSIERRRNKQFGDLRVQIKNILQGMSVMDNSSFDDVEGDVAILTKSLEFALTIDRTSATLLLDIMKRQKLWEQEARTRVEHNLRSIALEAEIEFVYQRNFAISEMEALRSRLEGKIFDLAEIMKSQEKTMSKEKKKLDLISAEVDASDKKIAEVMKSLSEERELMSQIGTSNGVATSKVQTRIAELGIVLQHWTELKRDLMIGHDKQHFMFSKAQIAWERTKEKHDGNRLHFDKILLPSFKVGMDLIAHIRKAKVEDDYDEDIEAYHSQHQRDSYRKKRTPSPPAVPWGKRGSSPSHRTPGRSAIIVQEPKPQSPNAVAVQLPTASQMNRVRDRINKKAEGDFDFNLYLDKDYKKMPALGGRDAVEYHDFYKDELQQTQRSVEESRNKFLNSLARAA